jgi:hypothetical protein
VAEMKSESAEVTNEEQQEGALESGLQEQPVIYAKQQQSCG